ncbi:MAG: glycosyl hydrolase [Verrucomicrobiia bacterium]
MKNRSEIVLKKVELIILATFLILLADSYSVTDSKTVKKLFSSPPREFSNAPLWVWNDMLTEEQIKSTMKDLSSQGVKQVFVHPRPGLMTPYLSEEWFKLWKTALKQAERLDMNVWIYDENSYPSGFAGGWVPELMPESRGKGLVFKESSTPPVWNTNILAIYKLESDGFKSVTAEVLRGTKLTEGKYLTAMKQWAGNSPWHGNRFYVDLMYPGVTEKFLDVTHNAYKREVGHQFGRRIPGSFTDEPEIRPAGGLPWTEDINQQFLKRWGYSLIDNLPSLTKEVGDWQRIRHNYYSTLLDLFIERWAKPYFEYCTTNKLEFTGHYWEHDWPNCVGVPDNMAMAAWQHRPGIDILMNQYSENTHAQFGNVRSCREISSVANQLGKKRTLVELYGAGGWDLRFEDMKRIGDWLQALGVNTLDEHLSYITIRGARKRDHPQSFSYHEPWWKAYHIVANYFHRLTAALTQGEQINNILVIEPTTTAWMYQGKGKELGELGDSFFNFLMSLESAQVEYDLGCENVIANYGDVVGNKLRVGKRHYQTVIIPPIKSEKSAGNSQIELNLNKKTVELLEKFISNGGTLISCNVEVSRIDGNKIQTPESLPINKYSSKKPSQETVKFLKQQQDKTGFQIYRDENDKGILFHHRRILADGELLFLVNTSLDFSTRGIVKSRARGIEELNPHTGEILPYPYRKELDGINFSFELPPAGSLLLFLSNSKTPEVKLSKSITEIKPTGDIFIKRIQPNILTVDYVNYISAGGETRSNIYFYRANQFAFSKNGMPRNPWDSAVQFKDEIIKFKFPEKSGFEVAYKFTIDGPVPPDLAVVIEKPEIYQKILCNDSELPTKQKEWWLDKAFGKIPIARFARSGENFIKLSASPMTIYHEIEPIYILGSFSLKPVSSGFVITADSPITIQKSTSEEKHSNNPNGTMWLSAGVGHLQNENDKSPFIIFDLGRITDLAGVKIWNYNENNVKDLTSRGAKRLRIYAGNLVKGGLEYDLGEFTLKKAAGAQEPPQFLQLNCSSVRYVKFVIVENYAGTVYPCDDNPPDNGFVGLAEVKFLSKDSTQIKGVRIHSFSSQLASQRRIVKHLIDNSGLDSETKGWNRQGHPFYSAGVSYSQKFIINKPQGEFVVCLNNWYGSVAEVIVNKKRAGYMGFAPWECNVTPFIKNGENLIEVVVIGTLKNTLGPHHGNPPTGSAWPAMFQQGPDPGPPPGTSYSTIAYGMFEPFVLKQIQK